MENNDRHAQYNVLYCISDNYFDPVYGYRLLSVWMGHRLQMTLKFLGPDLELAMDYVALLNSPFTREESAEFLDYATPPSISDYIQ